MKLLLCSVLAIVVTFVTSMKIDKGKRKKCRALALEGGGDMGSYEVGVLKAWVENLPPEEVQYDVITGVSVGSINAVAIALHDIGKEKETVDWMLGLWSELKASDIYRNWWGGIVEGIFFEEGLWDNHYEMDFLNETFQKFPERKLFRKVNINTVEFNTGEVYTFNETWPFDDLARAIRASTSMPFAFPHTYIDDYVFVDGGAIWNVDISGAIERCLEVVDDEKDIIVDTILCNGAKNVTSEDFESYNAISNYLRYNHIKGYYGFLSDYEEIKRGYPNVNFRYTVVPKEDLPSGFLPLGFVHEQIMEMIKIGEEDGAEVIKLAEQNPNYIDELLNRMPYRDELKA